MRSTGVPPDCERLGHPVVPVSRRRQPEGRDGARAAELPRRHETLQLDVLGPEAQHHADHEHRVAPGRGGDDRLGVLGRERDGLLQEDVLPAASARSAYSRWSGVGRQMSTASTSGS